MGSVEDGKDPTSSSFEKTDWFVIDGKFKMNQQYVPWLLQKKKKIDAKFSCINRNIISKFSEGSTTSSAL